MRKILKDNKGFTLLELLVSVMIMVIVMGAIYNFLNSSTIMSNKYNDYAKRQNACDTTMQLVRGRLANATYVEVVASDAYKTPENGYYYLYCGPGGGITTKYQIGGGSTWKEESLNTVNELKFNKVYVSFVKDSPLLTGDYKGLHISLCTIPYNAADPACADFVETDTNNFNSTLLSKLSSTGTKYSMSTVMTFHNTEVVKVQADLTYPQTRCVRFQLPDGASLEGPAETPETPTADNVDFDCTYVSKGATTDSGTGATTVTYTVSVKNNNTEEKKGKWNLTIPVSVCTDPIDSVVNGTKKDDHSIIVNGANLTLAAGAVHQYDVTVICAPVMMDYTTSVSDASLTDTLDNGDQKYKVTVTVTNPNSIAQDKAWETEEKVLGLAYPATSAETTECTPVKIESKKYKFTGTTAIDANSSKTIEIVFYCPYIATPMPKNITVLADTKNYEYNGGEKIGLVAAGTESVPYNNSGGAESKNITVQPGENLTVYSVSSYNSVKNTQKFAYDDITDNAIIYVQGTNISLTQPTNWMIRDKGSVVISAENSTETRIDDTTVQIKCNLILKASSMIIKGDEYEGSIDLGVEPIEPSAGNVSGTTVIISGTAANDVAPANEVTRINDFTYKIKKAADAKVTIHFDTVNIVNSGGHDIHGYKVNGGSGTSADTTVFVDTNLGLKIEFLPDLSNKDWTVGTPFTATAESLSGVTDLWIQGTTVSTTKPSNFMVDSSISVNISVDTSPGFSKLQSGEAYAGVEYVIPGVNYGNPLTSLPFSLKSGQQVTVRVKSSWSSTLVEGTYTYDQLVGKNIYISGDSISVN